MPRTTRQLDDNVQGESESLDRLQPGTTLEDRYLILGMLGAGGMSSVYKGRDLHFPNVTKLVAIKEMVNLIADQSMHEMIVKNFEREADLLATLSHPATPAIYDNFSHKKRSYLVMEFIDGDDLEAILAESTDFLPEERVIGWAIELCDVLSYLHNIQPEPIIFRDVKPSNVMIDHHNHVRLIDFGIARNFQPGEKGTMIGTEGYSPPEQYRGEASPAGDVYALGATLHHLLTKRDPRVEAPFSFAERPARSINPLISPEIEAVISRALEYDPKDRYPSAMLMKEAMISAAKRTGLLSQPSIAAVIAQSDKIEEIWSFKCEDEIRGSPMVYEDTVYVGCYDNNLYALDKQTGEFQWKYATEGGITGKPAAEDGVIFIGSEDGRLYALTANRGSLVWTYYAEGPIRSSPTLSEGHIFVGSDDRQLHVVNQMNGRRAWRVEANDAIWSTPFVQDELVYFGSESGDFYCYNFKGELKWRKKAKRGITSSAIIVDDIVYYGSRDWTMYAIDSENGWQIWRFRMRGATISSPSFSDGLLFIGCGDNNIYCVDAKHAREIWRYETDHQVTGSPVPHDGSIYCGSVDGSVYCLDLKTGRLRWRFHSDAPITGTPVISDNVLYIGSTDHKMYALIA
ncbi:MAG: PQQ-binding-like beta-propeller repeat protein [Anaerolineales bacterium]|nr:PQQ-binding-like beta-propeller repeat protein [Anaerolineales bacterium]